MGFTDYKQPQAQKIASQANLTTVQGVLATGEQYNVPLPPPDRSIGILGGLSRVLDVIATGEYAVGGILAGKSPGEGIRKKISPSDTLFRSWRPDDRFEKVIKGIASFGVNTAFDPLTYLTLGTGGAIKVTTQAGTKIALSKTGKEMLKDLSQEVGEKAAREQVAVRAVKDTALQASKGLKFAGYEIVPRPVVNAPFSFAKKTILATKPGQAISGALEGPGNAIAKAFNTNFGLDEVGKGIKTQYINRLNSSRLNIRDDLVTTFAGTTKEQRELIGRALASKESGSADAIKALSPELQKLALRTRKIFDQVGRVEEKRGILNSWITDYVPHAYQNKKAVQRLFGRLSDEQVSSLLRFNKQRSIPYLDEAEKLGLEPVYDVAELLNARLMSSEKAIAAQDMFIDVASKMGKKLDGNAPVLDLMNDHVKLSEIGRGVPKALGDVWIPRATAENIASMYKGLFKDPDTMALISAYDKALNYFKGSVTVLFPAFHGRNAISNTLQNALDIGVDAINPQRHGEALGVLTGATGKITNKFGTEYSYDSVRKMARNLGVLTERVTRSDLDRALTAELKIAGKQFSDQQAMDVVKNIAGTPIRTGQRVGRAVEGEARLVNFLSNLRKGYAPEDAARKTQEFLFDYDDLTMFERDYLRRAIPFYTWTRKNIGVQLKTMATKPGAVAEQARLIRSMSEIFGTELSEEDKQFAPDFVLQGAAALLGSKNDESTFLVGFDTPLEAVTDVFNNPAKEFFNQIAPWLKAPIEGTTGYNFFKETQIKEDTSGKGYTDYPDFVKEWLEFRDVSYQTKAGKTLSRQTVNPEKKWLLSTIEQNMGLARVTSQSFLEPIKSFYSVAKGEPVTLEDKTNAMRFIVGLRAFTINDEASRRAIERGQVSDLLDILERNGVIGRFERAYIPKNSATLREN